VVAGVDGIRARQGGMHHQHGRQACLRFHDYLRSSPLTGSLDKRSGTALWRHKRRQPAGWFRLAQR
jgi:hypothetical protein